MMRMLGVFEKGERVRHIGHLDIQRAVQRGLRRSGLPVAYSGGFNPHIQVAFASALSTGACGRREIMDVKMAEEISDELFLQRMNDAMPPGLRLSSARAVEDRHPALTALLKAAEYEIVLRDPAQAEKIIASADTMMAQPAIFVMRKTKSGQKEVDMKPLIIALSGSESMLRATLTLTEQEACKPVMLIQGLKAAAGLAEEEEIRTLVIRTRLLGEASDGSLVPLETL